MEAVLRRIAVALAVIGLAALAGCSTDEVSARAADVRASADVFASSARGVHSKEACASMHDPLDKVGSLAGQLAAHPDLGARLSPQVTAALSSLARAAAGSRAEWTALLDATDDLGAALRSANETTIRVTAGQVVVAVKLAQAGCKIAG
ncbi:MAG TPA: hypothetical protein VMU51_36190 [Mycobacteriales bacterium]|nr:hypothetical protein [Mycobacteriales bacterium]